MKIFEFRDFMKKYNLKNDTMNQSEIQTVYNYPISPRVSKVYSVKGFVNIDNGSQGGTHWTCFIVKDKKSHYFDSFGGQLDKFLLNQFSKPTLYRNYKIQNINPKLRGSYRLYYFYLMKRMNSYDVFFLKKFE